MLRFYNSSFARAGDGVGFFDPASDDAEPIGDGICFLPEPSGGFMLAAGIGLLAVLYRLQAQGRSSLNAM